MGWDGMAFVVAGSSGTNSVGARDAAKIPDALQLAQHYQDAHQQGRMR